MAKISMSKIFGKIFPFFSLLQALIHYQTIFCLMEEVTSFNTQLLCWFIRKNPLRISFCNEFLTFTSENEVELATSPSNISLQHLLTTHHIMSQPVNSLILHHKIYVQVVRYFMERRLTLILT